MKRIPALLLAAALMTVPTVSAAQDARALQASKIIKLALILLAADRRGSVNLNRDSAKEISRAIPEMSPEVADNIVAYRIRKGRFASLLDLLEVPGVDREVVTRNRHRIVL
ncbi:MAG: helix-hairpin-helix domain-containing protein [Gammaproteobacteria bacterium]|nr:helix-hairpin-helix domain-containing protein [Gammaproteobacteria bacterium]